MTDMTSMRATLGNQQWLRENETRIKALLPDTWTLFENLAGGPVMNIAFGFKLLGINWRSTDEFGQIMVYLTKIGILQRQNGYQFRANPSSIFDHRQESA